MRALAQRCREVAHLVLHEAQRGGDLLLGRAACTHGCLQLRGLLGDASRRSISSEQPLGPLVDLCPAGVLADMQRRVHLEPWRRGRFVVHGGHVVLHDADDLTAALVEALGHQVGRDDLGVEFAILRRLNAQMEAADGRVGRQLEQRRIAPFEDRVLALQGVGHVDDVAHAHIADDEQRRAHAVDHLALELLLAAHQLDAGVLQPVQSLAVADDAGLMDDELLVGRVEADLRLRHLAQRGGVQRLLLQMQIGGRGGLGCELHLHVHQPLQARLGAMGRRPGLGRRRWRQRLDPGWRGAEAVARASRHDGISRGGFGRGLGRCGLGGRLGRHRLRLGQAQRHGQHQRWPELDSHSHPPGFTAPLCGRRA
mmetsp:Transcript_9903/g.23215  ORF Transcript_9903/g.23215 Transcript_9903/m.23215 type:complete len:368 (-) Transcript_9903:1063-2166(-)